MPARGWTYEDSAVISRSAANRLGSRLMMSEKIDADPGLKFDRRRFLQLFPGRFTMDQLNKLDDNGVAKAGAVLEFGDPIYVAVKDDPGGPTMKGRRPVRQEVETWNYNHSATVAHASRSAAMASSMR
jgi:DNA-directed RNA polymerase beta subunit